MNPLTTARLLLRPPAAADVDVIVDGAGNYEIARNLARVPYPYHRSDAEDFIAWSRTQNIKSAICAIEEQANPGHLIGCISSEWSAETRDAAFGYWLARPFWGKGYATEAGLALARHSLEIDHVGRLVAACHDDNPASRRVLEKIGFTPVGVGPHFSRAQNAEVPSTEFELTEEMWRQNTRLT